jgi:hypothetical protein
MANSMDPALLVDAVCRQCRPTLFAVSNEPALVWP